jgi:hypothetical protein
MSSSTEVVKVVHQDPPASSSLPPKAITVVPASSELAVRDLVEIKAFVDRVL